MQGDFKSPVAVYQERFARGAQRNITDFLKASITTYSKILAITIFTLVAVYCTCKIAKDAFRIIVLHVTTFTSVSLVLATEHLKL